MVMVAVQKISGGQENNEDDDSTGANIEGPTPDFAEVDPCFIGGMDNMISFIVLNINYPEKARERGARHSLRQVCSG